MVIYEADGTEAALVQYDKYKNVNEDGLHVASDGTYLPSSAWEKLEARIADVKKNAEQVIGFFEAVRTADNWLDTLVYFFSPEDLNNVTVFLAAVGRHDPALAPRIKKILTPPAKKQKTPAK